MPAEGRGGARGWKMRKSVWRRGGCGRQRGGVGWNSADLLFLPVRLLLLPRSCLLSLLLLLLLLLFLRLGGCL